MPTRTIALWNFLSFVFYSLNFWWDWNNYSCKHCLKKVGKSDKKTWHVAFPMPLPAFGGGIFWEHLWTFLIIQGHCLPGEQVSPATDYPHLVMNVWCRWMSFYISLKFTNFCHFIFSLDPIQHLASNLAKKVWSKSLISEDLVTIKVPQCSYH